MYRSIQWVVVIDLSSLVINGDCTVLIYITDDLSYVLGVVWSIWQSALDLSYAPSTLATTALGQFSISYMVVS